MQNLFFTTYLLTYKLIWSTRLFGTLESPSKGIGVFFTRQESLTSISVKMARIPEFNFTKNVLMKRDYKLDELGIVKIISFSPVCNPFSQILLLQNQKKAYKLG